MTLSTNIIARPTINLSHYRIHEGRYFGLYAVATGLAAGVPKYYFGTSPPISIAIAHLISIATVNPGVTFEFFEGAAASGGTQLFSVNQDRDNPILATGTFFEDPIVTSEGTRLYIERIGTATTGGEGGFKDRDEDEIVTASSTIYLFKITPLANNTSLSLVVNAYSQPGPGFV